MMFFITGCSKEETKKELPKEEININYELKKQKTQLYILFFGIFS